MTRNDLRTLLMGFLLVPMMNLISCTSREDTSTGPTRGHIQITCDESFRDLIEQEEDIFERLYPNAVLDITYANAVSTFERFFEGQTDAVIVARALTDAEVSNFKSQKRYPRHYPFATTAIAFIQQKQKLSSDYCYEELISSLREPSVGTQFVIEHSKSGIGTELLRILDITRLPSHFFALESREAVFDYVTRNEQAIGIIDWSAISDTDSPYAKSCQDKIQVIGISQREDADQSTFFRPYQFHLQSHLYPFTRDLYFISKTGMNDVGTGFAFFLSGEIGQKIILKTGLYPKFQTERIIQINNMNDLHVVNE